MNFKKLNSCQFMNLFETQNLSNCRYYWLATLVFLRLFLDWNKRYCCLISSFVVFWKRTFLLNLNRWISNCQETLITWIRQNFFYTVSFRSIWISWKLLTHKRMNFPINVIDQNSNESKLEIITVGCIIQIAHFCLLFTSYNVSWKEKFRWRSEKNRSEN